MKTPPSTDDLLRMLLGEATVGEQQALQRRLDQEPELARRHEDLRIMLDELAQLPLETAPAHAVQRAIAIFSERPDQAPNRTPGWVEHVRHVLHRLVVDGFAPQPLVGFRGTVSGHRTYTGPLGELDVQTRSIAEGRASLRGQVRGPGDDRAASEVVLIGTAGTPGVFQEELDERGRFRLDLECGSYRVLVRVGEDAMLIEQLEVSEDL